MTFSVLCWDPNTETHGAATATGMPAVGAFVPFVSAGIGAIATQGYSTNRLYGQDGLELLERGWSANEVLDALIKRDSGRDWRQLLIIDNEGNTACHTGKKNEEAINTATTHNAILAGNMLRSDRVIIAMEKSLLESNGSATIEDKLMRSMVAAETAGGDKRGTCSAALMTERSDGYRLDLRVDYSNQPIDDLNELLKKMRSDDANNFLNRIPTRRFPYRH